MKSRFVPVGPLVGEPYTEVMSKRGEWDFALRLRGTTPGTLPLAALADYMKEFAALLGDDAKPVFAGVVKGSTVLRARQTDDHPVVTKHRIQAAANDTVGAAGRSFRRLSEMVTRDSYRAEVLDWDKNVVLQFQSAKPVPTADDELLVHDAGELDGCVVSVAGVDDTVHIRLSDPAGGDHKVVTRDMKIAQALAARFRGGPVRVQVHGTWKRTNSGKWEAHQVYVDDFEDLDDVAVSEVFTPLKGTPESGWSRSADPTTEWEEIRGLHDHHA